MDENITFEKDKKGVKNPRHLQRNVYILFSPCQFKIEPASYRKIDTEVNTFLPKNSKVFLTSKFRGDEINELFHGKHCLWVEILNKSFEDHIEIKKGQPLGFLVAELENLKFQHVPQKKRQERKRRVVSRKRKRQAGGFLSCYDFAYVGRDTVNPAAKVAPGIIKGATNNINNIAKQRIDQITSQGGKEIERVLPNVLRGAIEDVYQIPFRLLGNFGKQQLNKLKRKILN